jgi:hypothetical protein
MKRIRRAAAGLAVGLLLGVAAGGCGGDKTASDPTGKGKLEEVGEMLKTLRATREKPPARLADLGRVEPFLPVSAEALRKGEIVYLWGVGLSSGSDKVLAYEKKAETEGGWVLLQDGTVKEMSADELKAAPKAK